MPEVAVNKYRKMMFFQYDVRFAWQPPDIEPKSIAMSVQVFPDFELGLCVTALDPGHHS